MVLFTRDEALVTMLRARSSRPVRHIHELNELRELLNHQRLDAVVIDCDDHAHGLDALKLTRNSEANQHSPCVAIANAESAHADAQDMGAWIVIEKTKLWKQPETIELWLEAVRRREHYRFPTRKLALVDSGGLIGRQVTLLNISLGGACFETQGAVELERHLTLRLSAGRFRCERVWRDQAGRVGVRFLPKQFSDFDLRRVVYDQDVPGT